MDGLDKKQFLEALAYLDAFYTNFNFDFNNETKIGVWYSIFSHFEFTELQKLFKDYARDNVYAPTSPTSLLNYAEKKFVEDNQSNVEKAWQKLLLLIRKYGFSPVQKYSPKHETYVSRSELILEIEQDSDEVLRKVFNDIYSRLKDMTSNNRDFVRKEFFELYNKYYTQHVKNRIFAGHKLLNGSKQ